MMKKSYRETVVFLFRILFNSLVDRTKFLFNHRENKNSDADILLLCFFISTPPFLVNSYWFVQLVNGHPGRPDFISAYIPPFDQMFFFFFLVSFCSLMSIQVLWLRNLIHSALFLVLYYFLSGCLLITFGADFIGFSLIMVYVGAMAILLLFLVMMLDIKIGDTDLIHTFTPINYSEDTHRDHSLDLLWFYYPVIILGYIELALFIIDIVVLRWFKPSEFFFKPFEQEFVPIDVVLDSLVPTIVVIGQVLYTSFFVHLLLIGFILFVAVIGALTLTVTLNKKAKQQALFKQLSRKRDNAFKSSESKTRSRLFRHYPVN